MANKYDAVKWVPGEWTNRAHDKQDGRHGHTVKLSGPNDPLLRMIHPDTPIDPEGYVGWWMVDNWDPTVWYIYRIFTHRKFVINKSMGYHGRVTKEWLVEIQPFHHIGWNWYWSPEGYQQDLLTAVMCSKFRVREGTEITGYLHDTALITQKKYNFQFRYRKELVRTTRI